MSDPDTDTDESLLNQTQPVLFERYNRYVSEKFVAVKRTIPLQFIDLLVNDPKGQSMGFFNHREVKIDRENTIATTCTSTMLEQPLKLVVTFDLADSKMTLFPDTTLDRLTTNLKMSVLDFDKKLPAKVVNESVNTDINKAPVKR